MALADHYPEDAQHPMTACIPDEYEGGDPACWLTRVCPECGALADADPPAICPRCHAELPAQ